MDFVVGGVSGGASTGFAAGAISGAGNGITGADHGPIMYIEPNRTSAIDDLRSFVIYAFIISIFLSFFLILPGIRSEKFPTFLCITTSLIVTSILLVSLFGTTWHVGQAPISAPYKGHSKDRIQGELSVKIGLQSVNITLRALKYYELNSSHKPVIMMAPTTTTTTHKPPETIVRGTTRRQKVPGGSLSSAASDELDSELEVEDEVFSDAGSVADPEAGLRRARSSPSTTTLRPVAGGPMPRKRSISIAAPLGANSSQSAAVNESSAAEEPNVEPILSDPKSSGQDTGGNRFTVERSNIDINYNERFYWIEPNQMRQEHQSALERGLPYPILTVIEYLSQDEAGFSWSRQYRLAGYYSYIILWLSFCVCILMFFLHCTAPKYGIYTMQLLGGLLLLTNFLYANLVPTGDQQLVIPFEGKSIRFEFGWNYWLVMMGGCLSLFVGTLIVIIDSLFPNFVFTTILDVDFDSHNMYYKSKQRDRRLITSSHQAGDKMDGGFEELDSKGDQFHGKPFRPPFFGSFEETSNKTTSGSQTSTASVQDSDSQGVSSPSISSAGSSPKEALRHRRQSLVKVTLNGGNQLGDSESLRVSSAKSSMRLVELSANRLAIAAAAAAGTHDKTVSEIDAHKLETTHHANPQHHHQMLQLPSSRVSYHDKEYKNANLKSTGQRTDQLANDQQVRL